MKVGFVVAVLALATVVAAQSPENYTNCRVIKVWTGVHGPGEVFSLGIFFPLVFDFPDQKKKNNRGIVIIYAFPAL